MKLVFLGTGHGVPSATRACSAAMLEVGGALYYIDAGTAMAERTLRSGRSIEDARAIFVTHCHGDHVQGVTHLVDLFTWKYKECKIELYLPEKRVSEAIKELVAATTKPVDESRIRFYESGEGEIYRDENIRVSLHPTKHLASVGRPSFGILVEGEGKRVYFTGDMSQWLEGDDFPTDIAASGLDLLVTEFAHFKMEQLRPHLDGVRAKAVAFTHVYPIEKYEELDAIKDELPFSVLTPSDMEEIEI